MGLNTTVTESRRFKALLYFGVVLLSLAVPGSSLAQSPIRAARSVHLAYLTPPAVMFYNEVTVQTVVPSSYYQVCGFSHGYFGIQELGGGHRRVLFSIWDAADFDRGDHDPSMKTEVLAKGDNVSIGRFGGEGTGSQSYFPYPWKEGTTYRFLVTAQPEGRRTTFSGYFFDPDKKKWVLVSSIRTPSNGAILTGLYSFVEDFRRDVKSVQERRVAYYGNGWVKTPDGKWFEITKAMFTADQTKLDNIQGSVSGDRFTLGTGGYSKSFVKPREKMVRKSSGNKPPADLPPGADPTIKSPIPELKATL